MTSLSILSDPATLGFDPTRLARLNTHFARYVDDGRLPGWQIAVTRHGELVHSALHGFRDREASVGVAEDTIWRIASMTKPITSVAAMMLWEEGAFELKDAISTFLPEFAETLVWNPESPDGTNLLAQTTPIQMWHLMTHTSGLTYGFMFQNPVDAQYRAAGFEWGVPPTTDLAGICSRLASLPLVFQPGSEWNYSMSIDVLGRIVEIISGQTLAEFLQDRIFGPLGMVDTGFSVPAASVGRVATLYMANPTTKLATPMPGMGDAVLTTPSAFLGGGGLVSTMHDYLRFAEMLRRGGELDDQRLLSPATLQFMTQNHLPDHRDLSEFGRPLFSETTFDGVGFGLLGSVTVDPAKAKVIGSVGEYGWGGAFSTFFWVDPLRDLTCVFMTQLLPSSTHPIRSQLKQLVHQALIN